MIKRHGLLFVFCLALAIRVAWILWAGNRFALELGDQAAYDAAGWELATGKSFMAGSAYRPPLYSLFIGLTYALAGHSPLLVKLVQAVLGALTCVFVFRVSARLGLPARVAALASLIVAVNPLLVHYTAQLLAETLFSFLVWLAIVVMIDASGSPVRLLTGVLLGLAVLVRPDSLLLAASLLVWAAVQRREGKVLLILAVAGIVLAVAPWTIRNYEVFGRLVPLTTNGGTNLWIGSNRLATGDYYIAEETKPARRPHWRELEEDAAYREAAVSWIMANPREWLGLIPRKIGFTWRPYPQLIAEVWSPVFLSLAALGFAAGQQNARQAMALALIGVLFPTVVSILFFGARRFAVPANVFLAIPAAITLGRVLLRAESIRREWGKSKGIIVRG